VEDEGGGSVAGETGDMLDDDGEEEDRVGATLSDSSSSEDEPDDEVGSSYSLTQIRYFLFLNNTVPVHTGTLHIVIRNTGCGKILYGMLFFIGTVPYILNPWYLAYEETICISTVII
jgi:hypothetical protein